MKTYDACAVHHMIRFPMPSPSIFAFCKWSKTGGVEGLGARLLHVCADVTTTRYARGGHCNTLRTNLQLRPGSQSWKTYCLWPRDQWPCDHGKNPLWPCDCSEKYKPHLFHHIWGHNEGCTSKNGVYWSVHLL